MQVGYAGSAESTQFTLFTDLISPDVRHTQSSRSWKAPRASSKEWEQTILLGQQYLNSLPAMLQDLFRGAVETALAELPKMQDWGEEIEFQRTPVKMSDDYLSYFASLCEEGALPGVELKVREEISLSTFAAYVPHIGSIVLYVPRRREAWAAFSPGRAAFFQPSFRDGQKPFKIPQSLWKDVYCADKIAMAGRAIAPVPTFRIGRYDFVQTGNMCDGSLRQADAWSLTPFESWQGPTYSYQGLCEAWDRGEIERGNKRGLLVKVRGKIRVLTTLLTIFDCTATPV